MKIFQTKTILSALFLTFITFTAAGFYDPSLQRWVNRDPIAELGFTKFLRLRSSFNHQARQIDNYYAFVRTNALLKTDQHRNLYTFSSNSPLLYIDPYGLEILIYYPDPKTGEPTCSSPVSGLPPCEVLCEVAAMVAAAACCLRAPMACAGCVATAEAAAIFCIEKLCP